MYGCGNNYNKYCIKKKRMLYGTQHHYWLVKLHKIYTVNFIHKICNSKSFWMYFPIYLPLPIKMLLSLNLYSALRLRANSKVETGERLAIVEVLSRQEGNESLTSGLRDCGRKRELLSWQRVGCIWWKLCLPGGSCSFSDWLEDTVSHGLWYTAHEVCWDKQPRLVGKFSLAAGW